MHIFFTLPLLFALCYTLCHKFGHDIIIIISIFLCLFGHQQDQVHNCVKSLYWYQHYVQNALRRTRGFGITHKQHWCLILGLVGSPSHVESLLSSGTCTGLIQSLQSKYTIILQVWRMPPEQWYWYRSYAIQLHNNTSGMENASWELVLVPVLSIFVYTHKSILSVSPGETPIFRTEPRNCAVIFSPGGNAHQPNRTKPRSYTVWLPHGFGSLPNSLPRLWETPYTTY